MNAYNDGNTELINLQRFTLPKNAHRFDITFIVDEDGFASHKIEPKMAEEIPIFQKTLNKSAHQRPFIAFFDNVSVIFVYKEGKGYQCLDSWGGIYGRDLLIAFDKRKPTFCDDALEALRKKPSSAITDFVELLTLTPGEQPNRPLPFKITSDAKNPILIEFDSYDGSKKAATPIFLMALLLKQHIKALEAEGFTKGGLKHIGFSLGGCESKKTELFHKNIKESCALLKIHWTNHP
uniref:Uncharacterized protein n=1 Tax=Panagrolaimus sp. ES5 TaxID=591445 RepID=A0AC34FJ87_9BILA